MPQRTNEFQELVSLIRRSLAKDGDTVQDSAMVRVQGLETEREIDLLHKTSDGFSTIKIAVESKDEGRKIDVTTLEQLCAKYRGEGRICVDKFMLVSRNGFTEGAIEKARLLDVPLLTLDEAKEFDWSSVAPADQKALRAEKFNFRMAPHFDSITTTPPLPVDLQKGIIQEGRVRYASCPKGHDHGSFLDHIVKHTLKSKDPEMLAQLVKLEAQAPLYPNGAVLKAEPKWDKPFIVSYAGVDYPVQSFAASIHAVNSSGKMVCTAYRLESSEGSSRVVHHMCAEVGDRKFTFVLPDGLKSKKIAVRMAPSASAKARSEGRKREERARKKAEKKKRKRKP